MPTDYKRHLKLNENYDWVDAKEKVKSKAKPRDISYDIFLNAVRDRDRLFYKEAQAKGDIEMMEFLKNRHK